MTLNHVSVALAALMMGMAQGAQVQALSPQSLFAQLNHKTFTLINVHVPYAGEIAGTDAFIPYDRILNDPALPKDRRAAIVVYCRSGRMSALAAQRLVNAGYRDVQDLTGGMNAWWAAGYPLSEVRR